MRNLHSHVNSHVFHSHFVCKPHCHTPNQGLPLFESTQNGTLEILMKLNLPPLSQKNRILFKYTKINRYVKQVWNTKLFLTSFASCIFFSHFYLSQLCSLNEVVLYVGGRCASFKILYFFFKNNDAFVVK